jgi:hypothetical protein
MMETTMNDPWAALEEPSTRTPRSLETREKTSRRDGWKEPTLLPDPTPRDGLVFKWIRASARGNDDKVNVDKRFREGWDPVRAEDHPEILQEWRMAQKTGIIEFGGLILCTMPQEFVDQRNSTYLNRAKVELTSAEEHYMRDNDEIIKKFKESRRATAFTDKRPR